jgi:hypothetical protein
MRDAHREVQFNSVLACCLLIILVLYFELTGLVAMVGIGVELEVVHLHQILGIVELLEVNLPFNGAKTEWVLLFERDQPLGFHVCKA